MPGFDGIGANEYIVDVTHPDTVDFISAVDTPYVWELNIWYHTLNVGFRTRIAGETDFPCIYDGRVGMGRTYAKLDGPLSYTGWLEGMQSGRSYVSDGKTHLMDFASTASTPAPTTSEIPLNGPATCNGHAEARRACCPRSRTRRSASLPLRPEALLGHRARPHRQHPRSAGGDRGERQSRRAPDVPRRRQGAGR